MYVYPNICEYRYCRQSRTHCHLYFPSFEMDLFCCRYEINLMDELTLKGITQFYAFVQVPSLIRIRLSTTWPKDRKKQKPENSSILF